MSADRSGTLYIVATPIGNLEDITVRAIKTLETVDWIACEDTRHSRKLLQHFGIHKPLISLHDHNEAQRADVIKEKLMSGEQGALISDAGTPLISDPGYVLVSGLRESGLNVVPIPGASAIITALSAAGLPTDRFSFEGFLPAKKSQKKNTLEQFLAEPRTVVMYESTHRILDTLDMMHEIFDDARQLCVAKELTKSHERFVKGSVQEVVEAFEIHPDWKKGEFVLILEGAETKKASESELTSDQVVWLQTLIAQNLPVKQISEIAANVTGMKKKQLYDWVLQQKKEN